LGATLAVGVFVAALFADGKPGPRPAVSPQAERPNQGKPDAGPAEADIFKYQGFVVRSIRFRGLASEEFKLRPWLVQKEAEPLDRAKIQESIRNLYRTGRFSEIAVEAERQGQAQVELTFVFSPTYFIGNVSVDGAPGRPTPAQIVNASKLQLGEPFSREKLRQALERITRLMEDNGYYRSTLTDEEHPDEPTQQVAILLKMLPGERAHVGEVKVTGSPGLSKGQIEDTAHMHPGDPVSPDRVTKALERLRKKYEKQARLLAEVSITDRVYRPESNAVDYSFRIEPGPVVDIEVEGLKIKHSVLKKNVPVYEENAVDDDLLNEGRLNLLDYLQTQGYFDALVRVRKDPDPKGTRLRVLYSVERGSRHKLAVVQVAGNKYFDQETLLTRMQVQAAGKLLSHGRYSQALLNRDLEGLKELYRANGFQQISIKSQQEDNYQGHDDELAVVVQVEEGPQTLVGTLHLAGNDTLPEDRLRAQLSTVEGQPYSEYNVALDREAIVNLYLNEGFPEARLEASAKPAPGVADHVDVTFTLQEGERVFVDEVLVSGLNHTRSKVVQREITIRPGDPLSQNAMLETQRKLYDLGIFGKVDTALQDPDGKERDKNVLINLEEAKRYTFNYGIGFEVQTGQPSQGSVAPQGNTGASPRVSFEVTRLNFRGLNHTLLFKTNVGSLQQRALLSYQAPRWFGNDKLKLTVTAFYDNTLSVTTFTSQRLEASVQVEETLSRISTLLYRYSYRRVKAEIASNFNPDLVPLLSRPVRVGLPSLTYIRDKRDNPIETRKGNYTTLDAGVAAGQFGSEADFSRVVIQNSTYQPIGKKIVFARSTRIGLENVFSNTVLPFANQPIPLGHTTIPLPERLFAGGGNSHRGFAINQAGPRDLVSGQPLGGAAVFLNSLELRLPPLTLPFVQDNLSLVLFNDIGNVFDTPQNMLKGLLRYHQGNKPDCQSLSAASSGAVCNFNYTIVAIGAGLHYKTPIGPVRLDFGYNLNPPTFPVRAQGDPFHPPHIERARRFNLFFSIGQSF
jgi:outer membrane protein assembly complex protein YaeT